MTPPTSPIPKGFMRNGTAVIGTTLLDFRFIALSGGRFAAQLRVLSIKDRLDVSVKLVKPSRASLRPEFPKPRAAGGEPKELT